MNVVQHNLMAMFADRSLSITTSNRAKSSEKLSSGYKINRAADDAAGLAISEKMRKQIRGLRRGADNIGDGISLCQTADGALTEVTEMLQRMNELAVQAANGTNSASDRLAIDNEVQQLKTEMDRVFTTTKFNEEVLFETPIPYTPVPVINRSLNADEIQIFSSGLDASGNIMYGGIELNHVRHTWEELGIKISADGKTFDGNQSISVQVYNGDDVLDDKKETLSLYVKDGDDLTKITRSNTWSADEKGIYVNDVLATTWDRLGIQDGGNSGEFEFNYRQQTISFEVKTGDGKQAIIDGINGKGVTAKYSWNIYLDDTARAQEKALSDLNITYSGKYKADKGLQITSNNYNNIDSGITYSLYADGDKVYLKSSDGVAHSVRNWGSGATSFSDGTYPISDWGKTSVDGKTTDSSLITFDDSVTYKYMNDANTDLGIGFTFRLSDEAGVGEVVAALNGVSLNQAISAPNTFRATVAAGSSITPTASVISSSLSYATQKAYGRDFDNDTAQMTGTITRTLHTDSGASWSETGTTVNTAAGISTAANSSSQTSADVYLWDDIDNCYYKWTETTSTYQQTRLGDRTRTESYTAHYSYDNPAFHGTALNAIPDGSSFTYKKEHYDVMEQERTKTETTYGSQDKSVQYSWDDINNGNLTVIYNTNTVTDYSTWGTWSQKSSTESAYMKTSGLSDRITLSSGNGYLTTLTVTDSGSAIGNSTIALNFKASDYAYVSFSATERGMNAGNISDPVRFYGLSTNSVIPMKEIAIQGSANVADRFMLRYPPLNNKLLGIRNTNVLTEEDAGYAIGEIKSALLTVTSARSTIGALQNRLEHAERQNRNTQENTQAAESRIRDTDMADEMVRYSKETILQQAGQAMLVQANQATRGVLALLQ